MRAFVYLSCFTFVMLCYLILQSQLSLASEPPARDTQLAAGLEQVVSELDSIVHELPQGAGLDSKQVDQLLKRLIQLEIGTAALQHGLEFPAQPDDSLGPAKMYRVELTNALMYIAEHIEQANSISITDVGRLRWTLDRFRGSFYDLSSYRTGQEMLELIAATMLDQRQDPADLAEKFAKLQQDIFYIIDHIRFENLDH